jgi:hypothetical protein
MARRVIERERSSARLRPTAAPRVAAGRLRLASKLKWQQASRLGFSAHRSFRLSGVGNAIGAARAN